MNTDLTLAICMYNAERYIEETLYSVISQTKQDFHLLIVNDCSTDNSEAIVRHFFEKEPRQYELISFENNRGIGYSRHFSERHASTRYMMFLDADDCLYPQAIEKMYTSIIFDSDLMAVGCYLEYMDNNSVKIKGGIFLGETNKEGFYNKASKEKLIFMQPTAIYDRELALSVGGYVIDGYPDGKPRYQDYCEDLDLWTRMSDLYTQGKAIIVLPNVLCRYRKAGGLSANSLNMSIKMRYTKTNLKRRRNGEVELSFIEFFRSLTDKELRFIKRGSIAADNLRNAVFYLRDGDIIYGVISLIRSIWYKPTYIFDKIKNNFCINK
jgi:glycosyltransferase involved in cell wall biosynthesis